MRFKCKVEFDTIETEASQFAGGGCGTYRQKGPRAWSLVA